MPGVEISLLPNQVHIGMFSVSETLVASLAGSILFLIFALLYYFLKKRNEDNGFVQVVDMALEGVTNFYKDIAGEGLSLKMVSVVVFVFFYVLWSNLVGLLGDMFSLVRPALHEIFRPASTDITFNLALASACVIGSIIYGFVHHGFKRIHHYIPYKGVGLVPEVKTVLNAVMKVFDIIIGLFVGFIEIIGEVARMLSLSLRLFGNLLAGLLLLTLIIALANTLFHVPAVLPLIVFAYELFVGALQAFIFSVLVLVYFKMAGSSDH